MTKARHEGSSRFVTLDAMRGAAAMCVVAFHVAKFYHVPAPQSAYLAVDMFFALSGFVLARTYDPKFAAGLTAFSFMKARALRLYALGLMVGIAALLHTVSIGTITGRGAAIAILFNAFLLPTPVYSPGWVLFPTDQVAWSLFGEFWIANLLYAVLWRRLNIWLLAAILGVSLIMIAANALSARDLDIGWNWMTLAGGAARVLFSFFAGVALWRWAWSAGFTVSVPSWAVIGALLGALWVPRHLLPIGGLYDLICIVMLFPLLILLGAGATERRPKIGVAAGELSYALYILHLPTLMLLHALLPPGKWYDIAVAGSFVAAATGAAYLVHHYYDARARHVLARTADKLGQRFA